MSQSMTPDGHWVTMNGAHVFIKNGTVPAGGASEKPYVSLLAEKPDKPFTVSESALVTEEGADRAFMTALRTQYPYGVPCYHEAPVSALDVIRKEGIRGGVLVEDTVFATVGEPSEFVTSEDKLVVRFTVRKSSLSEVSPDMWYTGSEDKGDSASANLLREHKGVFGADISIGSYIPPGDISYIAVVSGGKVSKMMRYPF